MNKLSARVRKASKDAQLSFSDQFYDTIDIVEALFLKAPSIYESCVLRGYWKEEERHPLYQKLMLIVSELSEAMEADRKGKWGGKEAIQNVEKAENMTFEKAYETYIKGTVEEELADFLICLLDLCGRAGILAGSITNCIDEELWNNKQTMFSELLFIINCTLSAKISSEPIEKAEGVFHQALSAAIMQAVYLSLMKDVDILWHIEAKQKYSLLTYKENPKSY